VLGDGEGCMTDVLGTLLFMSGFASIESIGVSRSDSMFGESDRTELVGLSCCSSTLIGAASTSSSGWERLRDGEAELDGVTVDMVDM
jgi:hypothetical protein